MWFWIRRREKSILPRERWGARCRGQPETLAKRPMSSVCGFFARGYAPPPPPPQSQHAPVRFIALSIRRPTGSTEDYQMYMCVFHHCHYKALRRCRLVGSCAIPGENFLPKAYDHVCMLDTVTSNFAINSVFITIRSMRDANKFHFFSFFRNSFIYKRASRCGAPQASYERPGHRNNFHFQTQPAQAFPKKVNIF